MSYEINYTLGMCYDYINSMIFSSDIPFKLFPDITYPAKITAVHKRLKRELYNMNEAYDLLINEDMRVSFMTAVYDVFFTEEEKVTLSSIDDMIKKIFCVPAEELTARFVFCFDRKNEFNFYRALTADIVKATKYINSMSISDASKNALLSALIDSEGYKKKALEIAYKAKEVTLDIYKSNADYINSGFKVFKDEKKIRACLEKAEITEKDSDLVIAPTFINSTIVKCFDYDSRQYFILGFVFYNDFAEYLARNITLTLEDVGRLFSDKTRCDAVNRLKEKECYLAELAGALGVPNNTLHYHMELLMDAGTVLCRVQGRRIYYRINEKYFEALKKLGDEFIGK